MKLMMHKSSTSWERRDYSWKKRESSCKRRDYSWKERIYSWKRRIYSSGDKRSRSSRCHSVRIFSWCLCVRNEMWYFKEEEEGTIGRHRRSHTSQSVCVRGLLRLKMHIAIRKTIHLISVVQGFEGVKLLRTDEMG